MSLIFVDCEAVGPCPALGQLTEWGAVDFESYSARREWVTFHGIWYPSLASTENPAIPEITGKSIADPTRLFLDFAIWLKHVARGRPVFVSDNPAYDWQWINDGFWRFTGGNPFGHSARRISDFYAGLCGNIYKTQEWKRLRQTPHDHNPVHDAMGNVEAFTRLLDGER